MKKSALLLSAVIIISVIAGIVASKARVNHRIYVPYDNENVCDHTLTGKEILGPDPNGANATTVLGQPCSKVFITDNPQN
nr:hypothetical protein [uncultured Chitinophaga sp.]